MSLCFRQQRLLRRTEDVLRRSDPQLAAMLASFSRLGAAEPMPARERIRGRLGWLRSLGRALSPPLGHLLGRPLGRALALAGRFAARAGHRCAAGLLRAATAWAAASGSFGQVPYPDTSLPPGYGAGHGGAERAEREAGAG
jgi:hypothetical protein